MPITPCDIQDNNYGYLNAIVRCAIKKELVEDLRLQKMGSESFFKIDKSSIQLTDDRLSYGLIEIEKIDSNSGCIYDMKPEDLVHRTWKAVEAVV